MKKRKHYGLKKHEWDQFCEGLLDMMDFYRIACAEAASDGDKDQSQRLADLVVEFERFHQIFKGCNAG